VGVCARKRRHHLDLLRSPRKNQRNLWASVFDEKDVEKLFYKRWSLETGSEVCLNFGFYIERHEERYWSLYT
jgi:hypothetical protein